MDRKQETATVCCEILERGQNMEENKLNQEEEILEDLFGQVEAMSDENMAKLIKELDTIIAEKLDETERYVISERYGLHDGNCKSFKDIADSLNLSEDDIMNVHDRALKKFITG